MLLRGRDIVLSLGVVLAMACGSRGEDGPVFNGSFEKVAADGRTPDGWQTAGEKEIVQHLTAEHDPQRGHVARLTCTKFVPGTPSSHVMAAQFGHVGVARGKWYRLSLWARTSDLQSGVAQVGLANFHTFAGSDLSGSFMPQDPWLPFEFVFQSTRDIKPADSRLAISFRGTGSLWLSDVAIEETTPIKAERLPAASMEGVTNALPNSSFECGGAGWGCVSDKGTSEVFELLGQCDRSQASDGKSSWKLTLAADQPLVVHAGGYFPEVSRVRSLQIGNEGWIHVQPGQPYVLSAYVKSDRPGLPAHCTIVEADGQRGTRAVPVGPNWQRIELTHTPKSEQVYCTVGFSASDNSKPEGTLWINAVQFERGEKASPYRPRAEVEAALETNASGNIFTDPAKGLSFQLKAYNAAKEPKTVSGRLSVTDFWGHTVWEEKTELKLQPQQADDRSYTVLAGRQGFFRVHWEPAGGLAQSIRCAVIEPYAEDDSVFGFNHAFSREFLLRLSHLAGLRWWRDWSDEWDTVQPKQGGPFDFHLPDLDFNYILGAGGKPLLLLPTPTAVWDADEAPGPRNTIKNRGAKNEYQQRRAMMALKPKRLDDFAEYVRATVDHYRGKVTYYEILNESVHIGIYSVPAAYGYKVSDYIDLLKTAYQAAKSADPKCLVVGGLACDPSSKYEDQFVEQGGLQWCDVHNYHMYPGRARPEGIENEFKSRWEEMKKLGQAKPIWVTEFGVYGEDDPTSIPPHILGNDPAMNNAIRPDELTASADIVELTAVMCANGVRKVFFHAGMNGGGLHGATAGDMLFEYGGAPRKMYPAVAVLAHLLGPDFEFVRKWDKPEKVQAYEYRSRGRTVVILWTRQANAPKLEVPSGFQAFDLMGNPLDKGAVVPGEVPLYLVGK